MGEYSFSISVLLVENIVLEESNGCLRTRLIDFGDAVEIQDVLYVNTKKDVISIYVVTQHVSITIIIQLVRTLAGVFLYV